MFVLFLLEIPERWYGSFIKIYCSYFCSDFCRFLFKGEIKKVSFGGTTGLKVKLKDPERRKAFADRHNCKDKRDKTKPGYWSCNLPRYAHQLGLGKNMNTYW